MNEKRIYDRISELVEANALSDTVRQREMIKAYDKQDIILDLIRAGQVEANKRILYALYGIAALLTVIAGISIYGLF